jgi:hypothetical protein
MSGHFDEAAGPEEENGANGAKKGWVYLAA